MIRETDLARAIKKVVDGGQVGEPVFLNLARLGAPDAGDAALADLLDLAAWLVGDQPIEVHARGHAGGHVQHRSATLRFPRDRVAIVELSTGGSADRFERVLLLGTLGRVQLDSAEAAALVLPAERRVLPVGGLIPVGAAPADPSPPEAALVAAVLASVRTGQPARVEAHGG